MVVLVRQLAEPPGLPKRHRGLAFLSAKSVSVEEGGKACPEGKASRSGAPTS